MPACDIIHVESDITGKSHKVFDPLHMENFGSQDDDTFMQEGVEALDLKP